MHGQRVDAVGGELVLLVLHQRDQRTDDHRQPREHQRGQLVDERLAAARRHDDQRVSSAEYGVDRFPLAFLEILMAEAIGEDSTRFGAKCRRHRPIERQELDRFQQGHPEQRRVLGRGGIISPRSRSLATLGMTLTTPKPQRRRARHAPMSNLLADLRYALRVLRASPGFTAVALLSLTLGIGANTTIFSIANGLALLGAARSARRAVGARRSRQPQPTRLHDLKYVRDHSTTIAAIMGERLTSGSMTSDDGHIERFDGSLVTGDFFSGLGLRPALGQFFVQPGDVTSATGPVMVLSYDFWQTRFGGEHSVIGRRVRLNDGSFTIVGVAPKGFQSSTLGWRPSAWIGLADYRAFSSQPLSEWNGSVYTTVRLKPGVDRQRAATELDALAAQLHASDTVRYARFNFRVLPARGMNEEARQVLTVILGAMLALVSIVLLIACANVGNLLLARATSRRREIAVRIALGATRARLVQQLLAESFVLAVTGGALGLAGSFVMTRFAARFLPDDVPVGFNFTPDVRVLAFVLLLSALTALAFGLVPALRAARADLVGPLKDDVAMQGLRRSRLRSSLLVMQVAMGSS